ncbi:MAG: LacI family DNA-binding transcriptional regulator [Acidimicrobiia bacterium]
MTVRRATMADVARQAGVSKTSVSRVLNGKGELGAGTVERIRLAMDELGYVPAARAQSLANGKAGSIGVLVPAGMWWEWTVHVMRGVVEAVGQAGLTVTLASVGSDPESRDELARRIIKSRAVDGFVAILPPGMLDYLERINAEGMPVVLVDDYEHRPSFPSVRADNFGGAREGVRHLIDSTQGRIGAITRTPGIPVFDQRLLGYRAALEDAGIAYDEALVGFGNDDSSVSGEGASEQLLAAQPDLKGLFCVFDRYSIGALRALHRSGRRIPEDVAIVGFDDSELVRETDPPLTAIRQPLRDMGATAARKVLGIVDGKDQADELVLPTTLIVRSTTQQVSPREKKRATGQPAPD